MAALKSCPKHNMVAYLEKTKGSDSFHEIVDFLSRSLIFYALTIRLKVSTSLIEQFWNSAVSQTVNNVSQIKATISGQTVLISESSIRRDLLFNDDNGIDCLTIADIYENLPLMGYEGDLTTLTFQKALFSQLWKYLIHTIIHCLNSKSTSWDQFPTNVALAVICLSTNRTFNFSKMIFDGMMRNLEAKKKFLMYPRFVQVFLNNQLQNIPAPLDNFPIPVLSKKVFTNMTRKGLHFLGHVTPMFPTMLVPAAVEEGEEGTGRSKGDQVQIPHDSPLSGGQTSNRAEGALNLDELFVLCTNLSHRVLALENFKDAQAVEILTLKTRIKKLEKKCKPSISHHRAWLRSVSSTFDDLDVALAHGMDYMETEEAVDEERQSKETEELNVTHDTEVLEKGGSNEEPVNTASNIGVSTVMPEVSTVNVSTASRPEVSTATPMTSPTTTSVFEDEDIFLADALVMLSDKTKKKGVAIKEVEESNRPARSVLTLKPLPTIDPKDKGKGVLEDPEPAKKMTKRDFDAAQVARDEEEKYNVDERAKILAEFFKKRKKQLAEERAAAIRNKPPTIRNKPPTRTQLRSLMMNYLKHTGRFKHSQLNRKTFEEIQALYIKEQESATDFVHIGSEEDERQIQKMNKKATSVHEEKVLEESDSTKINKKDAGESSEKGKDTSKKRKEGPRMKRMSKKKKTDSNLEEDEHLKTFLKLVPDEEGIEDYEVLEKRIFRSDGSSRWIKTFSEMVTRIMFDANAEDELWQNQERWNLKSWDFYDNCGVHTLTLEDGTEIHMLAERKYPLTKETLERMMSLKLIAEFASESAYNLLRFIQNQIDESGGHDRTLAIPEQTATSKETSNLFMAGSLPKNYKANLVGVAELLRCCKDDKDWKLKNVKVTKEFKFIKEYIKE
ncbi:hypothetical protein Tco_1067705 [Tanacetum coccineum]|uniref:Synaptobrevin, longin-like domain protein n=1 Tax=Tanacetum coccineum TaxID=301880 RepID=A0ABQ5HFQ8_9ASTR